jgi:2-keto-4-pentenoate hydratase/2-oxohepta-3-ene-1,7-dioic acid hydratase in catechol pathway
MRLVSYFSNGGLKGGVVVKDQILPIETLAREAGVDLDPRISEVRAAVAGGPGVHARLHETAISAAEQGDIGESLRDARLAAPLPDPEKIICLGLNYRDHAAEAGLPLPVAPIIFAKFRNSLVGPGEPVILPGASEAVDYEAELAVVIGRRCKETDPQHALDHVAGAMAFNDISARDLQQQTSQWTAGKALDTFAPTGPALVTLDDIDDLQSLSITTRVNGTLLQDGNTTDMLFGIADTIAFLSRLMTLVPGDIIATGTPAGVGFTRTPKVLLKHGDVVDVEIETIGKLTNPIIDAAAGTSGKQEGEITRP